LARDLALERAWRERIRRYERSGLTIREFCKRDDLSVAQFSWWRAELRRRAAKVAPAGKSGKKTTKQSQARKNAKRSKIQMTSHTTLNHMKTDSEIGCRPKASGNLT